MKRTNKVKDQTRSSNKETHDPNTLENSYNQKSKLPDKIQQVTRDANVLAAYLREIKKWPLLTRQEEQTLAKKLTDSRYTKTALCRQWINIIEKHIKWRSVEKKVMKNTEQLDRNLLKFLSLIKRVSELENKISGIEKKIENNYGISYHLQKKLSREKAELLTNTEDIIEEINLIKIYRSHTIKKLRVFTKDISAHRTRIKLVSILREYITVDNDFQEAKQQIATANLRLVVGLAKKYCNRGIPFTDLIQEGNIGLLKSIVKFDYRLGNRLSTYACWWIRQSIIRSIEDKSSTIRVPVYINEKMKKHTKTTNYKDTTYNLTFNEDNSDMVNLYLTLQSIKNPLSLESPFGNDGSELHECIPDRMPRPSPLENVHNEQIMDQINGVLKSLSPRDEKILRLRFGIGVKNEYTLQEIGKTMGVSRERIRQIELSAIKKIKSSKHLSQLIQLA